MKEAQKFLVNSFSSGGTFQPEGRQCQRRAATMRHSGVPWVAAARSKPATARVRTSQMPQGDGWANLGSPSDMVYGIFQLVGSSLAGRGSVLELRARGQVSVPAQVAKEGCAHGHLDLKEDSRDRVHGAPAWGVVSVSVGFRAECLQLTSAREKILHPHKSAKMSTTQRRRTHHAQRSTGGDVPTSAVEEGQEARVDDAEEGRRERERLGEADLEEKRRDSVGLHVPEKRAQINRQFGSHQRSCGWRTSRAGARGRSR